MDLVEVTFRILFLILFTMIGFFAGRRFSINPRDISILLIYIILPAVIIVAVLEAPSGKNYLPFTLGAYLVCSILASLAYAIGSRIWNDSTKNLFAFSGGTGNTGYFGLPIAFGVFGDLGSAIAVFIIIGVSLYEFSFGYYLNSLGNASIKQSLSKIARLPMIYAFVLALTMKEWLGVENEVLISNLNSFKGAYSVLGMMVIGITLSKFRPFRVDRTYLFSALSWKFIVWPVFCFALVQLLAPYLTLTEQAVIMLMSAVPMAGNTVVIANELNVHPEKAATAVMASTFLALLTVPIALAMLQ